MGSTAVRPRKCTRRPRPPSRRSRRSDAAALCRRGTGHRSAAPTLGCAGTAARLKVRRITRGRQLRPARMARHSHLRVGPHPAPPIRSTPPLQASSTSRLSTSSLRTSSALLNRQPRRAGHPSVAAVRQPRRDRHRARPAATPSRRPRPLDPPRPLPPSSDDRRRLRLRHPQARARRAVPGRRELEHAKA